MLRSAELSSPVKYRMLNANFSSAAAGDEHRSLCWHLADKLDLMTLHTVPFKVPLRARFHILFHP